MLSMLYILRRLMLVFNIIDIFNISIITYCSLYSDDHELVLKKSLNLDS